MNKMKYMKKILFLTFAASACLVACNRNVVFETVADTGTLSLNLSEKTEFITVETKAGTDYTDFNNYDVVIDGPTAVSEKFSQFAGRVVELGSGNYAITVTSPDTEPAAFEQPIYKSYETYEI